jgi:ATP synthase F1 gamma subunit
LEVLKAIAVSQYRTLEAKLKTFEKLLSGIEGFFDFVDVPSIKHPFLNPQAKRQGVLAVTSDSGLLGSLNMQVINTALVELEKLPGKLIVVGDRGKNYVRDTPVPFVAFPGIIDEERHGQALQMRDYLIDEVLKGTFHHLKVVYPHPVSFTVQRVDVVPFLPFVPTHKPVANNNFVPEVILESSLSDILEYLVYLWIGQKLYEIFGLSRMAEFAARFVHLEESSQKLKELDTKTRLEYFRVRHELVDRNMRELFAARLLYASQ